MTKNSNEPKSDEFLLTVFFKHDQTKNLDEIQEKLASSGFWKNFPPEGIEVASWYVMMGIGHVVTIKVPPARLREVNIAIERNAWGAFSTEFYTSYDFVPAWQDFRAKALADSR